MSVTEQAPGRTVGVEEEFLLVDSITGGTVARAPEVLAGARASAAESDFHAELLGTQVEAASPVAVDLAGLRHALTAGRLELAAAAGAAGLRLVSSGTPVLPFVDPPVTAGERFADIDRRYAGVIRDYEACGCHVHVGVPDRDTAVAVVNHLTPWLPSLLALSVNSPYHRASDTGYGSWRMVLQSRFPGSGPAPYFRSAADHDRQVDRLVDCGVLADPAMTFWTARPSPRYPTVEVRAADAVPTVGEAVLQAALTRALVQRALDELAAGREAVPVDPQVGAAAQWTAARYGLAGFAVDPVRGRRVPVAETVTALFAAVRPVLERTGDLPEVQALWRRVRQEGTGADRQRRAAADGPHAVVTMLADQTIPAHAAGVATEGEP